MSGPACSRRGWLGRCGALALLAACEGPAPAPVDSQPGLDEEGWWPIPLQDHPGLEAVGGWARVSVPEALLELVVAQPRAGEYRAVWAVCTHGACEVAYEHPDAVVCPCHGSVFDTQGAVIEGPATEPLRRFPVRAEAGVLYVWRPL